MTTPSTDNIPTFKASRPTPPVPAEAVYITARQYCDRLGGISFTTLARMTKRDPEFPRARYFANRIRFFKVSEIVAYEHACEVRTAAKKLNNND